MKWSRKKTVVIAIIVVVALLLVLRIGTGAGGKAKGGELQAVPVTAAKVVQKAVPIELRTFGTVQSISSVAIKSQIGGILTEVHIKEGQDVKQGDLLFVIDPRPQEAALKQAEANLARDTVTYKNAEKESARQDELLKKGMTAEDAADLAKANAESLASILQADEAAVTNAQLQLEYCTIRSPCDGRTGELGTDPGNLVKANDATLLTINQIVPIEVDFALPQQELPGIMNEMSKGVLRVRAFAPGDAVHAETGELAFVDNQVDRATGTIRLKGNFPNADQRLWPGQFVNVVLTLSVQPDAIVIPTSAIQTGQKGSYVFVVKPDLTVQERMVALTRTMNGDTVVSEGLKAGERVVTDGQLRLMPGSKIEMKPARGPANAQKP